MLAVELDPRLAAYLRRELNAPAGFELIEADALSLHPRECFPGEDFKLVANIPYHITSPLLHAFLEGDRPPCSRCSWSRPRCGLGSRRPRAR